MVLLAIVASPVLAWSNDVHPLLVFNQSIGDKLLSSGSNTITYFNGSSGLHMLRNGTITTTQDTTKFNQYITFNASGSPRLVFGKDDVESELVGDFLYLSDPSFVFQYDLNFSSYLKSRASNTSLVDLFGKRLLILGSEYTFVRANYFNSTSRTDLQLLEGLVNSTLTIGEIGTYTAEDGRDYEINILNITDSDGTLSANISINGVNSPFGSNNIRAMGTGVYLGVWNITNSSVDFYFGFNLIEFVDSNASNDVYDYETVKVGGSAIADAQLKIRASMSGDVVSIGSISYRYFTGDEYYIPTSTGLREAIGESEPFLTDKWDVRFNGLTEEQNESALIFDSTSNGSGAHSYDLDLTNLNGIMYHFPFLTVRGGLRYGDDDDSFLFMEPYSGTVSCLDNETFISDNDYFIVSDRPLFHPDHEAIITALRYASISTLDSTVTFNDLSGGDIVISFIGTPGFNATGNLIVAGSSHQFWVGNDSSNPDEKYALAMDLDASGAVDSHEMYPVIEGGGVVDLGNMSNISDQTAVNIELSYMDSVTDYALTSESKTFTMDSQDYAVNVTAVDSNHPNESEESLKARLQVNGIFLDTLHVNESANISNRTGIEGLNLTVTYILTNDQSGMVEFTITNATGDEELSDSLFDNETADYTVRGVEFSVTASMISSVNDTASRTRLTVDGVETDSLHIGETQSFASSNLNVTVTDILTNAREGLVFISLLNTVSNETTNDSLRDLENKSYSINGTEYIITSKFISSGPDQNSKAVVKLGVGNSLGLTVNESYVANVSGEPCQLQIRDILTNHHDGLVYFTLNATDGNINDSINNSYPDSPVHSYTIGGDTFLVYVLFVSSLNDSNSKAKISLNGVESRGLARNQTQTLGDVDIRIDDVLTNYEGGFALFNISDGVNSMSRFIGKGQTETVSMGDAEYEITGIFISSSDYSQGEARFDVNGLSTDFLGIGESQLVSNVTIGVNDVLVSHNGGLVEYYLDKKIENSTISIRKNTTSGYLVLLKGDVMASSGLMGFYDHASPNESISDAKTPYGIMFRHESITNNVSELSVFYPTEGKAQGYANITEVVDLSIDDASLSRSVVNSETFDLAVSVNTTNLASCDYSIFSATNSSIVWTNGSCSDDSVYISFTETFNGSYLPVGSWIAQVNITDLFGFSVTDNDTIESRSIIVPTASGLSASGTIGGANVELIFNILTKGYPYVGFFMNLTSGVSSYDVSYASIGNSTLRRNVSQSSDYSGAQTFNLTQITSYPSYVQYAQGIYTNNLTLSITPYSGLTAGTYTGSYGWGLFDSP